MKSFVIIWLSIISGIVLAMAYSLGGIVATQNAMKIVVEDVESRASQTNDVAKLERKFKNALEFADDEWAGKYNVILARIHNIQSNMDTLDIWTGDTITVNYKNGMVKHFSVNEQTIREIP